MPIRAWPSSSTCDRSYLVFNPLNNTATLVDPSSCTSQTLCTPRGAFSIVFKVLAKCITGTENYLFTPLS